jgi:Adenosyl cobinamide kinase/adenosyl cobinamide phosphate guanylyltransferase
LSKWKKQICTRLCQSALERTKIFIATCEALDHEMQERIDHHQKERGVEWQTIECPIDIAQAIKNVYHPDSGFYWIA